MKKRSKIENWEVRDKINDIIDDNVEEIAKTVIKENVDYDDLDNIIKIFNRFCNMEDYGFTGDEADHALSMTQTLVILLGLESQGKVIRRKDGTWISKEALRKKKTKGKKAPK